jgi:hypothetical protein
MGRDQDKKLIRSLAKRLAEDGRAAARLRAELARAVGEASPGKGSILAALRRSPLVGADLNVSREETPGRTSEL